MSVSGYELPEWAKVVLLVIVVGVATWVWH